MTCGRCLVWAATGWLLLVLGLHAVPPGGSALGDASYGERVLSGQLPGSMRAVAQATKGAAARLRLTSVKEMGDESEARMVAYDPHGTRIVIWLLPATPRHTVIRVRVGLSGDERYSRRIVQEICSRLP